MDSESYRASVIGATGAAGGALVLIAAADLPLGALPFPFADWYE